MKSSNAGFSLVEMIVVLVLAALIIGMTAPHFRGFFTSRQLQNAVTLIENSVEDTYSRARSEQNIVGIDFRTGKIIRFTCNYNPNDIVSACNDSKVEEEILWENKSIGETLHIEISTPFSLYQAPPHGDIIDPLGNFGGNPSIREISIKHDQSEEEVTLILHKISGLLERK